MIAAISSVSMSAPSMGSASRDSVPVIKTITGRTVLYSLSLF